MEESYIGRTFSGRYKLTERIGTGGMAEVYRAEDIVLGRVVAVKVMLPQYASDAEFTDRFRKEAASAANLQNPYIVNIYDWGQDGNDYFIVMEYVRGSDLKSGIRERGALNQRKVAEIGLQVCQALTTAHSQDIIHRDIKPQNIMVQPDGNVKVMDFGIARAKNSVETQTGSVLGTAHYISPEQAQGKELTAVTDIYSLGIVLYEAVTGKLPFDGPDAVSVAMKQVNEMPAAPRTIRPDIDPDLEAIIGMAINKDPKKRFQTARDMQHALGDYLSGRPVNFGAGNAGKTAVMAGVGGAAAGAVAGAALGAAAAGTANADAAKTGVMPAQSGQPQSAQRSVSSKNAGKSKASKQPMSKKKKIGITVGVIAGIVAIGLVIFFAFFNGENVPDVVGKDINEAKTTITAAGFEVGTVDKTYSKDVAKDKVVSQDPTSMFKKPKGTKINLVVSMGAEQAQVPDVLGMSSSEAQAALEKAGFSVKLGEGRKSSRYESGVVMDQDPAGGTQADKGGTVTIIVSTGIDTASVPNVVGYSQSSALSTLQAAGFTVSINEQSSDTVEKGIVISQSPGAGTKLKEGGSVTITVSTGSDKIDVPSVVGKTVAEARSILQGAGFSVNVTGSTAETDIVQSQSPTGRAAKGATITLTCAAPK